LVWVPSRFNNLGGKSHHGGEKINLVSAGNVKGTVRGEKRGGNVLTKHYVSFINGKVEKVKLRGKEKTHQQQKKEKW